MAKYHKYSVGGRGVWQRNVKLFYYKNCLLQRTNTSSNKWSGVTRLRSSPWNLAALQTRSTAAVEDGTTVMMLRCVTWENTWRWQTTTNHSATSQEQVRRKESHMMYSAVFHPWVCRGSRNFVRSMHSRCFKNFWNIFWVSRRETLHSDIKSSPPLNAAFHSESLCGAVRFQPRLFHAAGYNFSSFKAIKDALSIWRFTGLSTCSHSAPPGWHWHW